MKKDLPEEDYLNEDELHAAIKALTPKETHQLGGLAIKLNGYQDHEDLLNDTIANALEARNCPRGKSIMRFLAETMSSILSNDRKKVKRAGATKNAFVEVEALDEGATPLIDQNDERDTVKKELQYEHRLRGLSKLLGSRAKRSLMEYEALH